MDTWEHGHTAWNILALGAIDSLSMSALRVYSGVYLRLHHVPLAQLEGLRHLGHYR